MDESAIQVCKVPGDSKERPECREVLETSELPVFLGRLVCKDIPALPETAAKWVIQGCQVLWGQ